MNRVMIVPAAGDGARLGSRLPKVVTSVNGRPMVHYLFDRYAPYVDSFVLIVQPDSESVVRTNCPSSGPAVEIKHQAEPTGMLDAILVPRTDLAQRRPTEVWITWCDQVAVGAETAKRLAHRRSENQECELLFPVANVPEPYIHLERDANGNIVKILHAREGDDMPRIGESDTGLFTLSDHAYFDLLPQFAREVTRGRGTGERNFLPYIVWLKDRGQVETFAAHDPIEALGVNTPEDLRRIEKYLNRA